jgi:hypothetical protein
MRGVNTNTRTSRSVNTNLTNRITAPVVDGVRKTYAQEDVEKLALNDGYVSACIKIDEEIKSIDKQISVSSKEEIELNKLLFEKKRVFNSILCADSLEQKKSVENAKIISEESIKAEQQVLEKNKKEQYLYIGFGAVVLLIALFVVTRNKN